MTYERLQCVSNIHSIIWGTVGIIYKTILHTTAVILSFLTRKVEVNVLNDSKYTAAGVYTSTGLTILLVLVIFTLANYRNASVAAVSTFIFLDSVVFLGLTFIPKVSYRRL